MWCVKREGKRKIPSFFFSTKSFVIETHTVITFTLSPPFLLLLPPTPLNFKLSQLPRSAVPFSKLFLECPQQMAPHIM
jgi:hypothetical protein